MTRKTVETRNRYQAATEFLKRNNLLGIIRGHEAQDHGYARPPNTMTLY